MGASKKNIFPTRKILLRKDKEKLLRQKGMVLWFTGLSGSGKTTIAIDLEQKLADMGFLTQVLDGDNVRTGINNNLGFSEQDRVENIRRIAEVAKLFTNCGIITICCFVSPTAAMRKMAKEIIGVKDFLEVFVNTPLEICEKRDVKGLYALARKGKIKDFTGINAPFEAPRKPGIEVKTDQISVSGCSEKIMKHILPKIKKP
jgi:adenylylsulfate kinase